MSGRSMRRHGDSPVVDVADVVADDALIDALVSGRSEPVFTGAGFHAAPFGGQDVGNGAMGGDPLIELFDIWRDEISSAPLPPVPAVRQASHTDTAGRHRQQRTARPAMFIAAAMCALLIGSAAVGSRTARQGDTLWPLASVLWSDRLDSVHSLNEVNDALADVQTALDAGRPDDAREALMRATVQLGHVDDLDMPESMPAKIQKLWVDVIPEAERRTQAAASAAADLTTAQPASSPSSTPTVAGTPSAGTPLLGSILEAIIASAQPPVSTDSSSTPADGPSVRVAAGSPPVGPSMPGTVTKPSNDAPTAPMIVAPTEPLSPATPTPPPVTTEPAADTSAAGPADPTTNATSSGDPKSTQNSAPAPPPPSTEPSDPPVASVDTSTPSASSDSGPAVAGSAPRAVDSAADPVVDPVGATR